MPRRRRAKRTELFVGVLVDKLARLELVVGEEPGLIKLTPVERTKPQTYFNFHPPKPLQAILSTYLEDYKPGNVVGLHRAVVAADGRPVPPEWDIHHEDHNHLDNRAANLTPMSKGDHKAYHDKPGNERLDDDPDQLSLFIDHLYLRVTYAPPRPPHAPLGYVPAVGGTGETPTGDVNPDRLQDSEQSEVEHVFQKASVDPDEPEHQRRLLYKKELRRSRLNRNQAERARFALVSIRRLGDKATAGRIVAAVTAKIGSERSAYRTLGGLIEGGFVEVTNSGIYRLTPKAYRVVPRKPRSGM